MLTPFPVRRLKSGLLPQAAIESSFDAIRTAQEVVDCCSSMVGMQSMRGRLLTTPSS